nr:MAG TPA: hypothetical protein [Caudoviricetes sp.]
MKQNALQDANCNYSTLFADYKGLLSLAPLKRGFSNHNSSGVILKFLLFYFPFLIS